MSKEIIIGFLISLVVTMASFIFISVIFKQLPPEVPLWYTHPWGNKQLTTREYLFLIPILQLTITVLNGLIAFLLIRSREFIIANVFALLNMSVSLLLAGAAWRIVNVAGPTIKIPLLDAKLIAPFAASFVISFGLTPLATRIGKKLRMIDRPHGPYREVRPLVRLGGIVVFIAFAIPTLIFVPLDKSLLALLLGGLMLIGIGLIDDFYSLTPVPLAVLHIITASILVLGGISMTYIRNPLSPWIGGNLIQLDMVHIGSIAPIVILVTVFWVFALINIVNWLDGMDGLATGIGAIASLTLFAISYRFHTPLPTTLSLILAGSLLGFLPFNFSPAKIILGSGAFLLGFLLAALAIYSEGRAATALLVLSLPILDAVFVILKRFKEGKPLHIGDKNHLHHRLLGLGLNTRQVVMAEWTLCILLGVLAVVTTGVEKVIAIIVVLVGGLLTSVITTSKYFQLRSE